MPEYVFVCKKCGARYTLQTSIATLAEQTPKCCRRECVQQFGVPGVSFKGPGFYRNDKNR